MRVLTGDEMRACDRHAIEALGLPGVVLMENAGREAARRAIELLGERGGTRVLVYCGSGNNGGDGFVVARYLHAASIPVGLVLTRRVDAPRGDAAVNAAIARKLGIPMLLAEAEDAAPGVSGDVSFTPLEDSGNIDGRALELRSSLGPGDLVIDALFGTGLDREVAGLPGALVEEIGSLRSRGCAVLALDMPSGLDSDTGQPLGRCVHADETVTFGYLKRGLLMHPGARLAGRVSAVDIGLPPEVESALSERTCNLLSEQIARGGLPRVPPDAHKGSFGHVLVVAGSGERPGAAALVCHGSLRAGAGLVTLATRQGGHAALHASLPEAMAIILGGIGPLGLEDEDAILMAMEGKDVIAIGPGIPRGVETGDLLERILRQARVPIVLDADALNALEGRLEILEGAALPVVLTPHPKEMARLTGLEVREVQANRIEIAARLAFEQGVYVVLKGAGTVIAEPCGSTFVCGRGGPALATGGTGDVLTGVISALLASGVETAAALRAAVMAHAIAGERVGERMGRAGTLASEVAIELCTVWREWGW